MHALSKPKTILLPVLVLQAETTMIAGAGVLQSGRGGSIGEDSVVHPATTILEIRCEEDRISFLAWRGCGANFVLYRHRSFAVCAEHPNVASCPAGRGQF